MFGASGSTFVGPRTEFKNCTLRMVFPANNASSLSAISVIKAGPETIGVKMEQIRIPDLDTKFTPSPDVTTSSNTYGAFVALPLKEKGNVGMSSFIHESVEKAKYASANRSLYVIGYIHFYKSDEWAGNQNFCHRIRNTIYNKFGVTVN